MSYWSELYPWWLCCYFSAGFTLSPGQYNRLCSSFFIETRQETIYKTIKLQPPRIAITSIKSLIRLSDFTFTFHSHALEKEMATHSSVLAWRISGMGEPGGLLSMESHRIRHNWSDLAAAAALSSFTNVGISIYFTTKVWIYWGFSVSQTIGGM